MFLAVAVALAVETFFALVAILRLVELILFFAVRTVVLFVTTDIGV